MEFKDVIGKPIFNSQVKYFCVRCNTEMTSEGAGEQESWYSSFISRGEFGELEINLKIQLTCRGCGNDTFYTK